MLRLFLIIIFTFLVCTINVYAEGEVYKGKIVKLKFESPYVTHGLVNDEGKLLYVLESKDLDLDDYIGKNVIITGKKFGGEWDLPPYVTKTGKDLSKEAHYEHLSVKGVEVLKSSQSKILE